jgi:hypothetical protein
MKANQIIPLLNYKYRVVGFVILSLAVLLLMIKEIHFKLIHPNSDFTFLTASIGLYFLAFTRTKKENSQTENLRYITFRITFGLLMSAMMLIALTGLTTGYHLLEVNMIYVIFSGLVIQNLVFVYLKRRLVAE